MRLFTLIISSVLSVSALAAEIVKVGVYDFPPYAFITDKPTGVTVQMLSAMNKFQQRYEFVAIPTTARRRYSDFDKNKFDMMIFENKNWGWRNYPVTASQAFSTGAEVYVALAKPDRGQDYFSDFNNKAMIGVLGYHYQFTGFNTDQDYLENNFNLIQTSSQKQSLELILNNRGEIAILSKEYLKYHFDHSPNDKAKLMISEKLDQIYLHSILVRNKHKLSIKYINDLLSKMKQKGSLTPLWEKFGLEATR
jgi:hypothetical protein